MSVSLEQLKTTLQETYDADKGLERRRFYDDHLAIREAKKTLNSKVASHKLINSATVANCALLSDEEKVDILLCFFRPEATVKEGSASYKTMSAIIKELFPKSHNTQLSDAEIKLIYQKINLTNKSWLAAASSPHKTTRVKAIIGIVTSPEKELTIPIKPVRTYWSRLPDLSRYRNCFNFFSSKPKAASNSFSLSTMPASCAPYSYIDLLAIQSEKGDTLSKNELRGILARGIDLALKGSGNQEHKALNNYFVTQCVKHDLLTATVLFKEADSVIFQLKNEDANGQTHLSNQRVIDLLSGIKESYTPESLAIWQFLFMKAVFMGLSDQDFCEQLKKTIPLVYLSSEGDKPFIDTLLDAKNNRQLSPLLNNEDCEKLAYQIQKANPSNLNKVIQLLEPTSSGYIAALTMLMNMINGPLVIDDHPPSSNYSFTATDNDRYRADLVKTFPTATKTIESIQQDLLTILKALPLQEQKEMLGKWLACKDGEKTAIPALDFLRIKFRVSLDSLRFGESAIWVQFKNIALRPLLDSLISISNTPSM